jgi:isopentenyl phosphate kinase
MYLIKLGGSAITIKSKPFAFRLHTAQRLTAELKSSSEKKIIVHGGGSFGHFAVKQNASSAAVQYSMRDLNMRILKCMLKYDLKPVSIPPSVTVVCENNDIKKIDTTIFSKYLAADFMPVTFGDLIIDKNLKPCIISGDTLMVALAKAFKPKKAIFVMDVNGLYKDGNLLKKASVADLEILKNTIVVSSASDVTGGIKAKIASIINIAKMGIEVEVINGLVKDRLKNALLNKSIVSTKVFV